MADREEVDPGEKPLNELGYNYNQDLWRDDVVHLLFDDDGLHEDHTAICEQPAVHPAGIPRV